MFDHENGVLRRNALDQRCDLVDVLMTHAGHRLVEQHHLGVERQRRRDLERALASVGHFDRRRVGKLAQAHIVEKLMRAAVEAVEDALGAPEIE